jgi:hypothetical protein
MVVAVAGGLGGAVDRRRLHNFLDGATLVVALLDIRVVPLSDLDPAELVGPDPPCCPKTCPLRWSAPTATTKF